VLERVKGKVCEDGRSEEFIYGMVAVRVCSTLVHFITMVHQNHLNNFRPTVFPKFFQHSLCYYRPYFILQKSEPWFGD
jgi:Ni,Fe-hydrogenase I small subunit